MAPATDTPVVRSSSRRASSIPSPRATNTGGRAPSRPPTGRDRRAASQRAALKRRVTRREPARLPLLVVVLAVTTVLSLFVGIILATGFLTPPGSGKATSQPAAMATSLVRSPSASVAFDAAGGWVADDGSGTVRRFDPTTGAWTAKPAAVGKAAVSIATGFDKVWAVSALGNTVVGIDATSGRVTRSPVGIAAGPVSVVTGYGGVWVASLVAGTVSRVDPKTLEVEASVALPDGAVRIALGDGGIWVTGQTDTLTRLDPTPDGVTLRWESTVVGQGPIGVAVGDGAVWVANALSGTVSKVDPKNLRVTRTIATRSGAGQVADPDTVAVWRGLVWVGDGAAPTVGAFNPGTGHEVGTAVAVAGVVRQLVVGDGDLWAATANPGRVVRLTR